MCHRRGSPAPAVVRSRPSIRQTLTEFMTHDTRLGPGSLTCPSTTLDRGARCPLRPQISTPRSSRVPRQRGARRRHVRGHAAVALHHTGAKSGKSRINPLAYQSDGGRYVVFASKGGRPTNPDWYHNLKAHPNATIEVGTDTIDVVASEASGEERERLFRTQAERAPQFADYERD